MNRLAHAIQVAGRVSVANKGVVEVDLIVLLSRRDMLALRMHSLKTGATGRRHVRSGDFSITC